MEMKESILQRSKDRSLLWNLQFCEFEKSFFTLYLYLILAKISFEAQVSGDRAQHFHHISDSLFVLNESLFVSSLDKIRYLHQYAYILELQANSKVIHLMIENLQKFYLAKSNSFHIFKV